MQRPARQRGGVGVSSVMPRKADLGGCAKRNWLSRPDNCRATSDLDLAPIRLQVIWSKAVGSLLARSAPGGSSDPPAWEGPGSGEPVDLAIHGEHLGGRTSPQAYSLSVPLVRVVSYYLVRDGLCRILGQTWVIGVRPTLCASHSRLRGNPRSTLRPHLPNSNSTHSSCIVP